MHATFAHSRPATGGPAGGRGRTPGPGDDGPRDRHNDFEPGNSYSRTVLFQRVLSSPGSLDEKCTLAAIMQGRQLQR